MDESTPQRLKRIARPITKELGVTEVWDIVGSQKNTRWELVIFRDPEVRLTIEVQPSDENIKRDLRTALQGALGNQ